MKKLLILFLLFTPLLSNAATLSLSADPASVGVDDIVQITMSITTDTSVNAFAGSLVYPKNLAPLSVSDGNSIIGVWLIHPVVGTSSSLSFSGFTPGGYVGRNGKLFSVLFRATSEGVATITMSDTRVLRNDGAGSEEHVISAPLALTISKIAKGGYIASKDVDPPEPFVPVRGNNAQPFSGQYYVVFAAVDKNSGIDHYEVSESRFPLFPLSWSTADSPYRITDQALTSDILIKAVDIAGNERIVVLHRAHILRPHEWIILVGILVLSLFVYRRKVTGRAI